MFSRVKAGLNLVLEQSKTVWKIYFSRIVVISQIKVHTNHVYLYNILLNVENVCVFMQDSPGLWEHGVGVWQVSSCHVDLAVYEAVYNTNRVPSV